VGGKGPTGPWYGRGGLPQEEPCDVWGEAAPGAVLEDWPTQPEEMPPFYRPRDLDFGNTGHGAALVGSGGGWRNLFTKNRRFVYWLTYQTSGPAVGMQRRARMEIPTCWSGPDAPRNSWGESYRQARLGDGILHVVERDRMGNPDGEALLFPLGWYGQWGLARLELDQTTLLGPSPSWSPPDGAACRETDPHWTVHLALVDDEDGGPRPLRLKTTQREHSAGLVATSDFVFVVVQPPSEPPVQGAVMEDHGVAVYRRYPRGEYEFVGILQAPQILGGRGGDGNYLRYAQVQVIESRGRVLLAVSVRIDRAPSAINRDWAYPRAFMFDVSDPLAVRAALTAQSGQAFRGQDLLEAVVQRRLPEQGNVRSFWGFLGLDFQPDVELPETSPWGGSKPIPVLAISSEDSLELYDLSALLAGKAKPPKPEEAVEEPSVVALHGHNPPVVGEDELLATYAESAGRCTEAGLTCGPREGFPVELEYADLRAERVQASCLVLANRYVLWGEKSARPMQGEYVRLLVLGRARDGGLALRRVGLIQSMLGAGEQQETLWPVCYDETERHVVGAARSHMGMVLWRLPPASEASCLFDSPETVDGYYPPAEVACESCGPRVARARAYRTSQPVQTLEWAFDPSCPKPSSWPDEQLAANLEALHTEEALPDLAGFGYGGEWTGGTVISRPATGPSVPAPSEVLLFVDRGGGAVWAHAATLGVGTVLGASRIVDVPPASNPDQPPLWPKAIPGLWDAAAAPWGDGSGDLRVAAISHTDRRVFFLRWSWGTNTLSPLLWAEDPGRLLIGGWPGVDGINAVTELRASGEPSGEVTHFACPITWRHRKDLTQGNQIGYWKDGYDLVLVPASGLPEDGYVYWRLPRASGSQVGIDKTWFDPFIDLDARLLGRDLPEHSSLLFLDVVQHGSFLYVLAEAFRQDGANHEEDATRLWLLTLDVLPVSRGLPPIDGEWTAQSPGKATVLPSLRHALPLHTQVSADFIERRRVFVSPNGRYVSVATAAPTAGFFLVDVVDPEDPDPRVVQGLRIDKAGAEAYRWWPSTLTLSEDPDVEPLVQLTTPMTPTERQISHDYEGWKPVWPLEGYPDSAPVWPDFSTTLFFETPEGELFLVLDGSPITLWKVDPDLSEADPLVFVGGLCGREHRRARAPLRAAEAVFLLGDHGCFGIPITRCESLLDQQHSDCCVLTTPTLASGGPGPRPAAASSAGASAHHTGQTRCCSAPASDCRSVPDSSRSIANHDRKRR